jgi:hypothetical protein
LTDRVAVLPHQQHAVVLVQRDHPHSSGMNHEVAGDVMSIDLDIVRPDTPDLAAEAVHRRCHRDVDVFIAD